jgi:hypothetical protein
VAVDDDEVRLELGEVVVVEALRHHVLVQQQANHVPLRMIPERRHGFSIRKIRAEEGVEARSARPIRES